MKSTAIKYLVKPGHLLLCGSVHFYQTYAKLAYTRGLIPPENERKRLIEKIDLYLHVFIKAAKTVKD